MSKQGLVFCVFAVLILALSGCAGGAAKTEPVLKIGHLAVLSGDSANRGQSEKAALQVLARRINQQGGLVGKKLVVVSVDTAGEPGRTLELAKNLISRDKVVALIGSGQAATAAAAALVAEQENIPLLLTATGRPELMQGASQSSTRKPVFHAGLPENYQGRLAAEFLKRSGRGRNAAVLFDQDSEPSKRVADAFVTRWKELGGRMVFSDSYSSQVVNFRPMLERIADEKPIAIFLPIGYKTAALIAKQAVDMGFPPFLIGGEELQNPQFLSLGVAAAEKVLFVAQTDLNDPRVQDWSAEYRQLIGQDPVLPESQFAAVAMRLLEKAIRKGQSDDPVRIIENLRLLTDGQGCPREKMAVVMEIHNNKPVPKLRLVGNSF